MAQFSKVSTLVRICSAHSKYTEFQKFRISASGDAQSVSSVTAIEHFAVHGNGNRAQALCARLVCVPTYICMVLGLVYH